MRLALLLTLLLALAPGAAHAERSFDWAIVDTLDITTNPSWVHSALGLTAGGEPVRAHLAQNRSLEGFHYMGDFRLTHYDTSGNELWSTLLGGKVHVEDLHVDSTGAIILHGVYVDTLTVDLTHALYHTSGDRRAYLLKLDANHQVDYLIDVQTQHPSMDDLEVITVDAHDQVWIGTSRWHADSEIHRLDANGDVAETILQTGAPYVTGLAVEPDGSVWASGFCSNDAIDFGGMPATCPFFYAFYLVKYAPGGVGQWFHFVEDITFQETHLIADGHGNAYFSGMLHTAFEFPGHSAEGPDWVYDFFLCKVDANGDFLWLREVPADDFLGDGAMGKSAYLASPPDGSVYFAGFSRGEVDWVGDGDPPPAWDGNDALVLHYSPGGECLEAKTAGSDWWDIADAIGVDDAGNVFIAGSAHDGIDFDGMIFPANFINSFIASLPAEDLTAAPDTPSGARVSLSNHPNPFNPSTRLSFQLEQAGPVRLTLHDARGARLTTMAEGRRTEGEHVFEWNGRDDAGRALPSGVYLARLETARGIATRRLVMLR